MHQFGWFSERGGNFLNLLQKEGSAEKGGVPSEKGEFQPWRILSTSIIMLLQGSPVLPLHLLIILWLF